ncbi:hypothetical protein Tco_0443899 [Tanacetum coccineum]
MFLASPRLLSAASTKGLVFIPTGTSWLRNSNLMDASSVSDSAFGFKALGRYVIQNVWNGAVASMISSMHFFVSLVLGTLLPST